MLSAQGTTPLKRTLAFVFLGLVLVALWIFRDNVRRPIAAIIAGNMASSSTALLEAGDVREAQDRALTAQNLAPELYAPIAALFQAARKLEPSSLYLIPSAIALFNHSETTEELRLEVVQEFLQIGQPNSALYYFQKLAPETRSRDAAQLLFADVLVAAGAARDACSLLERTRDRGPNPAFTAKLAQILLLPGSSPTDHEKAQRLLGELAATDRSPGSPFHITLRSLATIPLDSLRPSLLPMGTADWLEQLPGVTTEDSLLAARLRIAALPTPEREPLIAATVTRFRNEPVPLSAWLFNLSRPDLVLAEIDETEGRSSAVLYALRLRALQLVQGPAASLAWMTKPHPEVDPLDLLLTQAACHFQLGDRLQGGRCWDQIFESISISLKPNLPPKLYFNAMEQGQPDLAARVILIASRQPGVELPTSSALAPTLAYLQNENRLDALTTITEALLQREPGNPILQNNLSYLSFLLGHNQEAALKIAASLVKEHPDAITFRTTLALGQLVSNQPEKALATLDEPSLNWTLATDTDRAIRSKVLERNGRKSEANALRLHFSSARFTDIEKRILGE